MKKVMKSDEEWQKELDPETYHITREKGTERPFTGKYYHSDAEGIYRCVCCDNPLFRSDEKYESGSGWPSFWEPIEPGAVEERPDHSHGMERIELVCGRCEAHLGHVFPDGPQPTGLRYCINSASLNLDEKAEKGATDREGGA